jgi:hypothetical protein
VSEKTVTFPLTKDQIIKHAIGQRVFNVTNYIILHNEGEYAVIRIGKTGKPGLFKKINEVDLVSFPNDTTYYEDSTINVMNPSAMARLADHENKGTGTLVVKGSFDHLSFIHREHAKNLVVADVTPPTPAKLTVLAKQALNTGRITTPIRLVEQIQDLNALITTVKTPYSMLPCHTEHLSADENLLFLDQAPEIADPQTITLIGCDLSHRTFKSLYGSDPPFLNICPKHELTDEGIKAPILTRCCTFDDGYHCTGNVACVSWGATVSDVEEAILDLFDLY